MSILDAIASQPQCVGHQFVPRVLLEIQPATVELFDPQRKNLRLFAVDGQNIYLKLFGDYDQEIDKLGGTELRNTFNRSAVYIPSAVRKGFKLSVRQKEAIVYRMIKSLIRTSLTPTGYQPVKIKDFYYPDNPGQVRTGVIEIDGVASVVRDRFGGEFLNGDWEISFKEASLGYR